MKPTATPANPMFSSGPCAKRPGWSTSIFESAVLGRSHRIGVSVLYLPPTLAPLRWECGRCWVLAELTCLYGKVLAVDGQAT